MAEAGKGEAVVVIGLAVGAAIAGPLSWAEILWAGALIGLARLFFCLFLAERNERGMREMANQERKLRTNRPELA